MRELLPLCLESPFVLIRLKERCGLLIKLFVAYWRKTTKMEDHAAEFVCPKKAKGRKSPVWDHFGYRKTQEWDRRRRVRLLPSLQEAVYKNHSEYQGTIL